MQGPGISTEGKSPRQLTAAPKDRGRTRTVGAWLFFRSTLARESGKSSSDRNCGEIASAHSMELRQVGGQGPQAQESSSPYPLPPVVAWSWHPHWPHHPVLKTAAWLA